MESYFSNPFLRFYTPSLDSPVLCSMYQEGPDISSLKLNPSMEAEYYRLLQERLGFSALSLQELKKMLEEGSRNIDDEIIDWALQNAQEKAAEEEKAAADIQVKQEIHPIIWTGGMHKGNSSVKEGLSPFELEFPDLSKFDSSPYAEEILAFLNPFVEGLQEEGLLVAQGCSTIDYVIERLREYAEKNSELTEKLRVAMKVKKLSVPYIVSDLPAEVILEFNELDEDDPLVTSYQFNPVIGDKIRELGVLLDRYDTSKEVLCLVVWSTYDNSLVCLPSVGLVPYPLCWHCRKSFGMQACGKCGVAKYCTRDCQLANWKSSHKTLCKEMSQFAKKHKVLYI